MKKNYPYLVLGIMVIGAIIWFSWPVKKSTAPTVNSMNSANRNVNAAVNLNTSSTPPANMISFSTADLPDRDPSFEFSLNIPKSWRVEYLTNVKAINFYDPAVAGTSLEQSQLFVQNYTASTFKISTRAALPVNSTMTINGKSVSDYDLKINSAKEPIGYPTWWSQAYHVSDVQTGASKPYTFTTFNFNPSITPEIRGAIQGAIGFGGTM